MHHRLEFKKHLEPVAADLMQLDAVQETKRQVCRLDHIEKCCMSSFLMLYDVFRLRKTSNSDRLMRKRSVCTLSLDAP